MSPEHQRLVQRVAGELLPRLGYPLVDLGRPSAGERLGTLALAMKYRVLRGGRGLLKAVGLFHPTRLLERRRPPSKGGRRIPPGAADGPGPTSAAPRRAGDLPATTTTER